MAHLVKKVVKGHPYWYVRECRRVNGRVVTVSQMYLGSADHLLARLTAPPPQPAALHVSHAGDVAALYALARQIGMIETIDRHAHTRAQGPSPGMFLVAAAINRLCAPGGTLSLPAWLARTPLPRWLGPPAPAFDRQAFWNQMHRLSDDALRAIEHELAARVVQQCHVPLHTVLFNATNYYTFIDSFTTRCDLPQRGDNKHTRHAVRHVGLAVLADAVTQLPLFHAVYPGNQADAVAFASVAEEMAARLRALRDSCEGITLMMDKEQISTDTLATLAAQEQMHFISALAPAQHPALLAVPLRRYRAYEGREGWRVYRTGCEVFGARRTVVITHNDALQDAQTHSLWQAVGKARRALHELAARLRWPRRGGPAPTVARVNAEIARMLAPRHLRQVFTTRVYEAHGSVRCTFTCDRRAAERLAATQFGKTILFTDQHTWDTRTIVESYHAQHAIKDLFRLTADGGLAWLPMSDWTDHHIRVHAFYCMLGLLLRGLLQHTLREAGMALTPEHALQHLHEIAEVAQVYPDGRALLTTNTVTPLQRKLYELFRLEQWIAPLLDTTPR